MNFTSLIEDFAWHLSVFMTFSHTSFSRSYMLHAIWSKWQENELMLLKRVQIPMVKSLTKAAKADSMAVGVSTLVWTFGRHKSYALVTFMKLIVVWLKQPLFKDLFCAQARTTLAPAAVQGRQVPHWFVKIEIYSSYSKVGEWPYCKLDNGADSACLLRKGAPNPHLRRILQAKSWETQSHSNEAHVLHLG